MGSRWLSSSILESILAHLGAILGLLVADVVHLGAILARLGAILAHLGAILALLGAILAHLGPKTAEEARLSDNPPTPFRPRRQHSPKPPPFGEGQMPTITSQLLRATLEVASRNPPTLACGKCRAC